MNEARKTALVVDDEDVVRHALAMQLEALGYQCVTASGGREALRKMSDQDFALVMLDVRMPGMSGFDVLKRVRREYPKTCVVMLTGVVDTTAAAEAMRLGADDYLIKPCDQDYLSARLQRAHERREMARRAATDPLSLAAEVPEALDQEAINEDLMEQQVAFSGEVLKRPTTSGRSSGLRRLRWPWQSRFR